MTWAKYSDLKEIDNSLLNKAIESAQVVCVQAVSLVFEYNSSTSGMYAYWKVSISPSCTIHLKYLGKMPTGCGNHVNEALNAFSKACDSLGDRGED
jgi:hypothetical protein